MPMTKRSDDVANALSNTSVWRWLRRLTPSPQGDETSAQSNDRRRAVTKGDHCCGISDVGLVRPGNEDAFFVAPEQGLLVVADGLGGHAAGEVASALAIESICATVGNHKEQHEPVALLDLAFAEADQVAREHAHSKPECAGMGATLIVAMIRGDELFLAHVGDVRACDVPAFRLTYRVSSRKHRTRNGRQHDRRLLERCSPVPTSKGRKLLPAHGTDRGGKTMAGRRALGFGR
jgi:hypothetical protein